ncbi:hypothetical protein A0J61_07857 [Choanephora cucurbitarum]|uniref:Uncharacterized protein n=1 Tax=Choanephora cucurbitarum TaxID=101091 RepID=A0A1C7N618_9FUNG|nr:hypothetical protein A0J61_07857 [Choanephora cucurbitarum]
MLRCKRVFGTSARHPNTASARFVVNGSNISHSTNISNINIQKKKKLLAMQLDEPAARLSGQGNLWRNEI